MVAQQKSKKKPEPMPLRVIEKKDREAAVATAWAQLEPLVYFAHEHKRDEAKCAEMAMAELEAYKEFAESAYYVLPYTSKKKDGKASPVDGPSIRAAMALTRFWGNNITKAFIVDEDDEKMVVEGWFFDLQSLTVTSRPVVVMKYRWDEDTQRAYPLRGTHLYNAIQAGVSKGIRNAALNGMPVFLVQKYFQKAMTMVGSSATPAKKKTLRQMFQAEFGVTEKQINDYLKEAGKAKSLKNDKEKHAEMVGILTSLREGRVGVHEVFKGAKAKDTHAPKPEMGGTNIAGLTKGEVFPE